MRVLGNILWFIFGGLAMGLAFALEGLACFLTLIGIPFGLQWFKMVPLVFVPFGKGIRYPKVTGMKVFGNVLWVILVGWWNALACLLWGVLCCITIIGIPFGKQWFKLARLLFLPFGAEVYNEAAENKEYRRQLKLTQAGVAQYGNPSLPNAYGREEQRTSDYARNIPIAAVSVSAGLIISHIVLAFLTDSSYSDFIVFTVFYACLALQAAFGIIAIIKKDDYFCKSIRTVSIICAVLFATLVVASFLSGGSSGIPYALFFTVGALAEIGIAAFCMKAIMENKEKENMYTSVQTYSTTSAEETPEQNTAYTPSEAPIIENNTWTCPNCGKTDNPTDCAFCGGCGQKRVVENKSWACPSCGKTDNPTECNFCGNCGAKRPPQPIS